MRFVCASPRLQGGEDDIDSLLAKFKLQDERQGSVQVQEDCPPPSPRVYASFTPIPSQARTPPMSSQGSLCSHPCC
jgi:hypothetical protein